MATSSFANQFTVNSVPFQKDTETRINVKKRRERVVYRTLSNQNNINLAYLIGNEVTPSNNLVISDRSISLTQNRIPRAQDVTVVTTKSISLEVDKFLLTDIFTEEAATQASIPLFYGHTLSNFNSQLENFANLTLLSLSFTDYTFKPIDLSAFNIDTETGVLYNNIENFYNDEDQSFEAYFVKYTVKEEEGSTQTVNVYHELVSNRPVYQQADFGDLDETLQLKQDGRKKYLIELQSGGNSYLVTLPLFAQYAYKETPASRIKVLRPTATDLSLPWHVRVSNGEFIATLKTNESISTTFKYKIAEFNDQSFFPFPPYKFQVEQRAVWLYDNIIRVPKYIAIDDSLKLHMDIIVKDRSNSLKAAYTTDDEKVGNLYQASTYYTFGISSVDKQNGLIELTNKIRDDDRVFVSYYAEEDQYDFTFIDFNPVNNLDILDQRIVLYVNPETPYTGSLQDTLHYLVVDSVGRISFSSQVASGAGDSATNKMIQEDFYSNGIPRYNFYYDQESTASGLRTSYGISTDEERSEFSFIDKYTVESVLLDQSDALVVDATTSGNFTANTRYLVLADIYSGESESPEGLSQFDVRVQGGGIKEDKINLALDQNAEASWYWDLAAKRSYPGVGAFLAEVPQTLLTSHGGSFTRDQIVDVIGRHMKAGGYAVVNTYGIDPTITEITTTSGEISLSWPSYGLDVAYNVYYSPDIDNNFVSANSSLLVDSDSGNDFTISGVAGSTKYFVKVGAFDSNGDESFGPTVSATTLTTVSE